MHHQAQDFATTTAKLVALIGSAVTVQAAAFDDQATKLVVDLFHQLLDWPYFDAIPCPEQFS